MEKIELKKFLPRFYKQLHFNAMPVEVRAQFDEWVKKDTLTDTMRLWVEDFLEPDSNGNLVPKEVLDPVAALTDEDLYNLFKIMQRAVSGMAANKISFERTNHSAKEFLDDYFGRLFTVGQATPEVEKAIGVLCNQVLDNSNTVTKNIKTYILQKAVDDKNEKLFKDAGELDKFVNDIKDEKYNRDLKTQNKLQTVASLLYQAVDWSSNFDQSSAEYKLLKKIKNELSTVISEEAFSNIKMPSEFVNSDPHNMFYAGNILRQLYEDKNLFEEFSKYDDTKISKPITKAREFAKWDVVDDKDGNYVPPKHDDQLNFIQQIEKRVSDTYSDCFRKYSKLRGDRLFFKPEAKDIFKAIDKIKIKPTDGLLALLDKEKNSKVAEKIINPVAKQSFGWFTETLSNINNYMPKAIEGCWRNPTQMKAVLQEIMIKAVTESRNDPKAIQKAKTAMEIMAAMKYGLVSSKTMEALKEANFSMFGDKDLSWNKNAGVQMITNAFDKGIKAAFLGIGYGVTIVGNKVRMLNAKFTDKDNHNKVMEQHVAAEKQYQDNQRAMENTRDQNEIKQLQDEMSALGPNASSGSNAQKFMEATARVRELTDSINRRNNAQGRWDDEYKNRFVELENYWNYLQTGDTSNFFGKLSTKKAQEKFDVNKDQWLQQYVADNGIGY